ISRAIGEPDGHGRRFDRLLGGDVLVVAIASERLVAAFAVENDFVAALKRFCQGEGRNRRTIGKRLVVMPEQTAEAGKSLVGINLQDLVAQSKMPGYADSVLQVRMASAKMRRERRHRRSLPRAFGGDDRGIDSSTQAN